MLKPITFIITLLAVVTLLSGVPCGYAAAEDGNFTVIVPAESSYVYLENPTLVAATDDWVVVYDAALSELVAIGTDGVFRISDIEDAKQIGVYGNTAYVLTDEQMKVLSCDITTGAVTEINASEELSETPILMCVTANLMYLYNGYRSVYEIDLDTLTLVHKYSATRPLEAEYLTVTADSVVLSAWDDTVKLFDRQTKAYSTVLSSAKLNFSYGLHGYLGAYDEGNLYLYTSGVAATPSLSYTISQIGLEGIRDAFGISDAIYVIDDTGAVKKLTFDGSELTVAYELGSASSAIGRFNSPTAMDANKSFAAVADTGNKRIQVIQLSGTLLSYDYPCVAYPNITASAVTVSDTATYALSTEQGYVYKLENGNVTSIAAHGITDIVFSDGRLFGYSAAQKTIMEYTGGGFNHKFADGVGEVIKLRSSPYGKIIYALTDKGVYGYTDCGKQQAALTLDDGHSVVDFAVDNAGNLYLLDGAAATVTAYGRSLSGYTVMSETILNNAKYDISKAVSMVMDDNGSFYALSGDRHFLAKLDDVFTPVLDTPDEAMQMPTLEGITADSVKIATVKNTVIYRSTTNYEAVLPVISGRVLVLSHINSGDDFYTVLTEDGKTSGYVLKSAVTFDTPTKPQIEKVKFIHVSGGIVYALPYLKSGVATLNNTVEFTTISDACDFSSGGFYFYEVSYVEDGITKTGYIQRSKVMESYETAPDGKKQYARVSNKIGSTVNLFTLADQYSSVITNLSDGTKVQLLEEYDGAKPFTKVKYEDSVGYVLTAYLNADAGLTNGQVVGIIVAVLTVMITALFLLINKQAKKGKM